MNSSLSVLLLALPLALIAGGCKESRASAETAASVTQAASVAPATAKQPAVTTSQIVFIDKEHGCQCTAKRVDTAWMALQTAIAGKVTPSVERIHVDTQAELAAPYGKLRPMMAVPALYFLDAKLGLVELLQGEVTVDQIQAVLGTAK
jgi:hypothetical protein